MVAFATHHDLCKQMVDDCYIVVLDSEDDACLRIVLVHSLPKIGDLI